ncbi:hypothetical protein FB451DRAFT_1245755 [Mycena latifolia]|nr:hypothetical protein FB451DRAFT_1245755 [Mycena latifolia]
MSASSLPHTTGAMPFPKQEGAFRAFRSSSQSDWLATSLLAAKTITAGAECLPFPYVKGAFGMVSILLEAVEKAQKNREDLRELCGDVMEILNIIQDQISSHGDVAALKFKVQCQELDALLQGAVKAFMATMDTNFQMQKALALIPPNPSATQVPQSINNCPPSSRIFHASLIFSSLTPVLLGQLRQVYKP